MRMGDRVHRRSPIRTFVRKYTYVVGYSIAREKGGA
jgi:hypothetical protein